MSDQMNVSELLRLRLLNQRIAVSSLKSPEAVIDHLGALQAQDYFAALWAIGLRMKAAKDSTIEKAIADKKIVRTWPMRGTLHFVSPADVRSMLKYFAAPVNLKFAGQYKQAGLDSNIFERSKRIIEEALSGGNQLTYDEIYKAHEKAGIGTGSNRGIYLIGKAAQDGLICLGARKEKKFTVALLEEWLPEAEVPEKEIATVSLMTRYFKSRGPATLEDFSSWIGLTPKEVKTAWETVKPTFEEVTVEDEKYYFSRVISSKLKESSEVFLLPAYDEYLKAYHNRNAVLKREYIKSTILKNGLFNPVIIVNGRVTGIWKRTLKKEKVIIETRLFERISRSDRDKIQEKVEKYGDFLGLQPQWIEMEGNK